LQHFLPDGLIDDLEPQVCFSLGQFRACFLAPDQFRTVADWVGTVRARSYRRVSPHGPAEVDLDGRDDHYWHLLVLDEQRRVLAGSMRMALSAWHGLRESGWDGTCSYLEHCYPGLDASLMHQGLAYAEIGRTFVAPPYQRTSPVLKVLFQAMASIPLATGHAHLLGMVSYNHFEHGEALNQQFLQALMSAPFRDSLVVPLPRHPIPAAAPSVHAPRAAPSLGQLERQLEEGCQEPFRVPVLLRRYMQFGNAGVVNLSLARDFNQITEILMHCDLNKLSQRQRDSFVVKDLLPVWNNAGSGRI
jgi:hypothetical protein